jgi:hypothetical protein
MLTVLSLFFESLEETIHVRGYCAVLVKCATLVLLLLAAVTSVDRSLSAVRSRSFRGSEGSQRPHHHSNLFGRSEQTLSSNGLCTVTLSD